MVKWYGRLSWFFFQSEKWLISDHWSVEKIEGSTSRNTPEGNPGTLQKYSKRPWKVPSVPCSTLKLSRNATKVPFKYFVPIEYSKLVQKYVRRMRIPRKKPKTTPSVPEKSLQYPAVPKNAKKSDSTGSSNQVGLRYPWSSRYPLNTRISSNTLSTSSLK